MRAVRGLIRQEDLDRMEENWRRQQPVKGTRAEVDYEPVVRLYLPFSAMSWLLSEYDPENQMAFGLCDLAIGFPELGDVWLPELEEVRHPQGLRVLQEISFKPTKTLSQYANEARAAQQIVLE